MSAQLLDKIMQEADALSAPEQLRLAAHLLERASEEHVAPSSRLHWQDISGLMPYPLVGEDAQAWVTRTRRESDEHRRTSIEARTMKISEHLNTVTRLFLDTAPVIYFVEKNPNYLARAKPIFERIDQGALTAVTSPVTLAECLVYPYRLGRAEEARAFADRIVRSSHTTFVLINQQVSQRAAELRARYNLSLTDAFQAAVAIRANCDAFLTNDVVFKRVTELNVMVLDEVDPEPTHDSEAANPPEATQ